MADYRNRAPKRTSTTYMKKFSNIQEGMRELAANVPVIKNIFFSGENEGLLTQDLNDEDFTRGVMNVISELFKESFPSIINEDYPNTYSLSIRGDMFFFRTKDRVSLSWEYNIESLDKGEAVVDMFVIFNEAGGIVNPKKRKVHDDLMAAGWVGSTRNRTSRNDRPRKPKKEEDSQGFTIGDMVGNIDID